LEAARKKERNKEKTSKDKKLKFTFFRICCDAFDIWITVSMAGKWM